MKEKELSANDKRRRTTLCKKSIEELVNIILRKDDVERRLNKSVDTSKKLQVTNEKRIEILKDSLDKSEEIQNNQEKTIATLEEDNKVLYCRIAALNVTIDNKDKNIATLKENDKALYGKIAALNATIDNNDKHITTLEEHNEALYGRINSLEKTIRVRNKEARILFAIIVALIISVIVLFFI